MLLKVLRSGKAGIDAAKVLLAGPTELRGAFSSSQLPFILDAYMEGLQAAFLVAVVAACIATVASVGFRWIKLAADAPPAAMA